MVHFVAQCLVLAVCLHPTRAAAQAEYFVRNQDGTYERIEGDPAAAGCRAYVARSTTSPVTCGRYDSLAELAERRRLDAECENSGAFAQCRMSTSIRCSAERWAQTSVICVPHRDPTRAVGESLLRQLLDDLGVIGPHLRPQVGPLLREARRLLGGPRLPIQVLHLRRLAARASALRQRLASAQGEILGSISFQVDQLLNELIERGQRSATEPPLAAAEWARYWAPPSEMDRIMAEARNSRTLNAGQTTSYAVREPGEYAILVQGEVTESGRVSSVSWVVDGDGDVAASGSLFLGLATGVGFRRLDLRSGARAVSLRVSDANPEGAVSVSIVLLVPAVAEDVVVDADGPADDSSSVDGRRADAQRHETEEDDIGSAEEAVEEEEDPEEGGDEEGRVTSSADSRPFSSGGGGRPLPGSRYEGDMRSSQADSRARRSAVSEGDAGTRDRGDALATLPLGAYIAMLAIGIEVYLMLETDTGEGPVSFRLAPLLAPIGLGFATYGHELANRFGGGVDIRGRVPLTDGDGATLSLELGAQVDVVGAIDSSVDWELDAYAIAHVWLDWFGLGALAGVEAIGTSARDIEDSNRTILSPVVAPSVQIGEMGDKRWEFGLQFAWTGVWNGRPEQARISLLAGYNAALVRLVLETLGSRGGWALQVAFGGRAPF